MQEVMLDAKLVKLVPASPYLMSCMEVICLFIYLLHFTRVMDSGIMSSTILFNNGSRFNNLSHPVVINLSAVSKVLNSILSSHRSLSRSPSLFIERPKKPPAKQAIRHRESTTADVF